MNIIKNILIFFVRVYQYTLSPLLGQSCRHTPTCSHYAVEALQIWGPFKGSWLAFKRLSRCHPWGTHGYDPVPRPEKKEEIKLKENLKAPQHESA